MRQSTVFRGNSKRISIYDSILFSRDFFGNQKVAQQYSCSTDAAATAEKVLKDVGMGDGGGGGRGSRQERPKEFLSRKQEKGHSFCCPLKFFSPSFLPHSAASMKEGGGRKRGG